MEHSSCLLEHVIAMMDMLAAFVTNVLMTTLFKGDDPCLNNDCSTGQTCVVDANPTCADDFTCKDCTSDTDCNGSNSGGTCNTSAGTCDCATGYTGTLCNQCVVNYTPSGATCVLDPCQSNKCSDGEICVAASTPANADDYNCETPPVTPAAVSAPPDPCDSVKCKSSQCKIEIDGNCEAYCQCETTFQYNANNKSCDCPEGTTFIESINHCQAPPTSAPTKSHQRNHQLHFLSLHL